MNKDQVLKILNKLNLPDEEYCILGSSSLVLRGIKDYDKDIAITAIGLDKIKLDYDLKQIEESKYVLHLQNKEIEFLVKEKENLKYERYDDFLLQDINNLLQNKEKRGLKKDIKDIAIIKAYLERGNA